MTIVSKPGLGARAGSVSEKRPATWISAQPLVDVVHPGAICAPM